MILGIGIDIAEIARFRKSIKRFGDRLAKKILTDKEIELYPNTKDPARFLAMRFAAKEAASKALGTGFKQGIAPRQIGLEHEHSGKPNLIAYGKAAQLFDQRGIDRPHVSLSDDGGLAIAFVILETSR